MLCEQSKLSQLNKTVLSLRIVKTSFNENIK